VSKKSKTKIKVGVTNFLGFGGYFFSALQWFWVVVLYSSLIEGLAKSITPASEPQQVQVQPVIVVSAGPPSVLQIIFTFAVVVVMIALTVYVIWKMPSIFAKTGKKLVHDTADTFAPVVLRVQNKPITKKNRYKLSSSIVILMKIIIVVLPIILTFSSIFLEKQIVEYYIAIIITIWLASFSIVFFVAQYLVISLFRIKKPEIL